MRSRRKPLSAQRLAEASDAVLIAAHRRSDEKQDARGEHARMAHPLEMMRAADRPSCLRSFTHDEIEQACVFLSRLGVLERTPGRDAA